MRPLLIFLLLLTSSWVGAEVDSEFSQAQMDFQSGFYEAAIPRLEGLLRVEKGVRLSLIRSELAYAYLQIDRPKEVIQLFQHQNLQLDDLFLLGAALQREQRSSEAINMLESYLSRTNEQLKFRDAAELELGLALLKINKIEDAEKHLLTVSFDSDHPDLFLSARLQCSKIAFANRNRLLAEERLQSIETLLPKDHPLKHEYAYLRGELLLKNYEYKEAIAWLEKALPQRNSEKAGWTADTLFALGLAYMNVDGSAAERLEKAENYLLRLKQFYPSDRATLALGKCYLCKGKLLNNPVFLEKGHQLLKKSQYLSSEAQGQALLLIAEVASDAEASNLFEQSLPFVEKGKDSDDLIYLYSSNAIRLNKNDPRFPLPDILLEKIKNPKDQTSIPGFLLLLGKYYQNQQNHLLAEETFVKLAKEHPKSTQAAEAWYQSAIEAEELGKDGEVIETYRRYVYELYPQSPLAPEVFFNSYSYKDYLQGDRKAMHHLQGMQSYFPKSPYTMNAYYLLGLDYLRDRKTPEGRWIRKKSLTSAIDYFQQCEILFKELKENGQIPHDALSYYTYLCHRAILERALTNYTVAEESAGAKRQIFLDYSADVFQKLRSELVQGQEQELQDEVEYGLALTFLKGNKEHEAEKLLDAILERFKQQNINKGYYISRVWYEKGLLEMKRENYSKAIEYFTFADETGKEGYLSADQQLDNWIQISQCYRAMKQLDLAMLTLSKVINENVISSLRIKAMFLRAEIYEAQGRSDLARKQLESTSKKGGEWAVKAKDKLKQEYYYD